MTAIVAANSGSAIDIAADAACYTSDGVVVAFASKIVQIERMVVVVSGTVHAWPAIEAALRAANARTIDDLIVKQAKVFTAFDAYLAEKDVAATPCNVLIGGWSAAARRMILTLRVNHDRHGAPAGTFMALEQFCTGPAPLAGSFSVEAALASIEAQRATPAPVFERDGEDGAAVTNVGGWVDHARLVAGRRLTIERIHTWEDDRVGQPLAA
ncbi:hypothetical protein ACFSCV_01735 [Methylopila henanensis]|uniref:20S proteasome subunit A/B n=1 Tax=Methylopila henanensis TaxID=873516 RepID=A0ABW4K189_9HYPH